MTHPIHIGTSGWTFDWEPFFDEDIPKSNKLPAFSRYFDTVEVNYSYYRLPEPQTIDKWREETADDFLLALKLSRYITHIKRLDRVKTATRKFLRRFRRLKKKAGPILVQLPPNFKADADILTRFLKDADAARRDLGLKEYLPLAFEFRHETWFEDTDTYAAILADYDACWVFAHSDRYPYPDPEPTPCNRFVYFRFHGPEELYGSEYGKKRLQEWKDRIETHQKERTVFVYFNNDKEGYAAADALVLRNLLNA